MRRINSSFDRRRARIRYRLRVENSGVRPRLSVHRTNQHIYAQIIDDANRVTLASASTMEKDIQSELEKAKLKGGNKEAALKVGKLIAERALKKGIDKVVFDRSGYLYHGRVKSLAEAARDGGLVF
jgi:large subunit ribosomal protein L18